MSTELIIELFGYLGSALVVLSMLMASLVKLRLVNTIGSLISGTYALIIGSFPLALMNGCLIAINGYNLYKLLKTRKVYDMISLSANESFVHYFIQRHLTDIRQYFPEFDGSTEGMDAAYMALCQGAPAGILLGKKIGKDEVNVVLDYSTPAYRDCSVGACFYSKLPDYGIHKLSTPAGHTAAHIGYMKKMGFETKNGQFEKLL